MGLKAGFWASRPGLQKVPKRASGSFRKQARPERRKGQVEKTDGGKIYKKEGGKGRKKVQWIPDLTTLMGLGIFGC